MIAILCLLYAGTLQGAAQPISTHDSNAHVRPSAEHSSNPVHVPPQPPCPGDFVLINGQCVNQNCIEYGPLQTYTTANVCSGQGTCTEDTTNPGTYSCVCNIGYTAYGPYCSQEKCVQQVEFVDELIWLECGVYPNKGTCQGTGRTAQCMCDSESRLVGTSMCANPACISRYDEYCGGDSKAMCIRTRDGSYECQCSSYFEMLGDSAYNCQPKSCIIKEAGGPLDSICNRVGRCLWNSDTNKYSCECDGAYAPFVVIDVSGEEKSTCAISNCIYIENGVNTICNNNGACVRGGCECNEGFQLWGTGCFSSNCFVKIKNDPYGPYLNKICGGSKIANCVKFDKGNTASSYGCKCIRPTPQDYVQAGRMCVPRKCVYYGLISGRPSPVSCGGNIRYGSCILTSKTNQSTCECVARTTYTTADGVCIPKVCAAKGANGIEICSNNGVCAGSATGSFRYCKCNEGFEIHGFDSNRCISSKCFVTSDTGDKILCSGRGTCTGESNTVCVCTGNFGGNACETCAPGFQSMGSALCVSTNCISGDKICGGHGTCSQVNGTYACACTSGYTYAGNTCVPTSCVQNGKLCNGGGTCSGETPGSICSCSTGWKVHEGVCYPNECIDAISGSLCNGNGVCSADKRICECGAGYEVFDGTPCVSSQCITTDATGARMICGGNGQCVSDGGRTPTCLCNSGFEMVQPFVCDTPGRKSSGTTSGMIAIGVIAFVVIIALAAFLIWWFVVRRNKNNKIGMLKYPSTASQRLEQSGSVYYSTETGTRSIRKRAKQRGRSGSFLLEAPDDGSVGLLDN